MTKERFEEKIFYSPDGCWYWLGATHLKGYGAIYGKERCRAHRYSYKIYKGDVGKLFVCHTCDNPLCVNPDHLFLGTNQDNVDDKVKKNRQHRLIGELHPKCKFSSVDILQIRDKKDILSAKSLAKIYNTTPNYIRSIWHRRTWKHI